MPLKDKEKLMKEPTLRYEPRDITNKGLTSHGRSKVRFTRKPGPKKPGNSLDDIAMRDPMIAAGRAKHNTENSK